jgi:D-alanyl-D-alanine carboxypeptidase/D-alanyl-D-alanine-endopeptidase (penicillin-binding protein 4)
VRGLSGGGARRPWGACGLALAVILGFPGLEAQSPTSSRPELANDLGRIFADPVLARALMAVRVESLRDGRVLYASNDEKLVMPASNMKIVTLAVAADRLGWAFQYETRLEATGPIAGGTLRGDLIVTGGGDPSIGLPEVAEPAPLFNDWARALAGAGIHRVDGRLIGDDNFFDDEGLRPGWTLDDVAAGYAAPAGALSYNENAVTVRIRPGLAAGDPANLELAPPGHRLVVVNEIRTDTPNAPVDLELLRQPGHPDLTIRGSVPARGGVVTRRASVDNPTRFFIEALRVALAGHGIHISQGAWDIDELGAAAPGAERRMIARHESQPLSSLAAYFAKESQNFYGEMFLKTLGRVVAAGGTAEAGRTVVTDTLASWGIPADAIVIDDGSGLSRYSYVTAGAIVMILKRMWQDERFRGPFAAALSVAGHDGTLESRMKGTALDARLEAKTGTLSNVRALSGYLETQSGERLVFSMIANHFTGPNGDIDAVVERALARLAAG